VFVASRDPIWWQLQRLRRGGRHRGGVGQSGDNQPDHGIPEGAAAAQDGDPAAAVSPAQAHPQALRLVGRQQEEDRQHHH